MKIILHTMNLWCYELCFIQWTSDVMGMIVLCKEPANYLQNRKENLCEVFNCRVRRPNARPCQFLVVLWPTCLTLAWGLTNVCTCPLVPVFAEVAGLKADEAPCDGALQSRATRSRPKKSPHQPVKEGLQPLAIACQGRLKFLNPRGFLCIVVYKGFFHTQSQWK